MADLKISVDMTDIPAAVQATQRFERQINTLAGQLARGSITTNAYQKGLQQLSRQYATLGVDINSAKSAVMSYGRAAAEAAREQQALMGATQGATRGLNRAGVVMQQTGYQVGDFLVQVQSGTNALVAFGQQATQMAGLLTLSMNPKMIALGAALSIAIPLATALGAAFMRTRGEAEETTPPLERMSNALDELGQNADALRPVERGLVAISDAARVTLGLFEEINRQSLETARRNFLSGTSITTQLRSLDALVEQTFSAEAMSGVGRSFSEIEESIAGATRILGLTADEAREFQRLLYSISGTTRGEMAESFAEVVQRMEEAGLITDGTRAIIEQMGNELGLVNQIQESITESAERQARIQEGINQLLRERTEAYTDTQQTVNETIDSLNRQIAAQERIIRFGSESARVAERTTEEVLREEAARLRARGATQDQIDRVIELNRQLIEATEEAESVEAAIARINGISMGSVIAQVTNLASVLNITREAAMELAGVLPSAMTRERAIAQAQGGSGRGEAGMPVPGQFGLQDASYANVGQTTAQLIERENRRRRNEPDPLSELVAERERELSVQRELLNLSGQMRAVREVEVELLDQLGEGTNDLTETQLRSAAERIAAEERVQEQMKRLQETQEQFINDMASQMGDSFMSIIEGTQSVSDAFKDMARQIISQVMRLAVINPIINSIFGGVGGFNPLPTLFANAKGNIFSNGSVVPFANGGVVNSPVTFPMTGGRTGLMGEAGPEAIMPLKRGPDGKLGVAGGGNVTVQNHFHISANGDDSVKRIIAQEAPKIAALTQKQIVDQRRRGGAMKGAFG